MTLGPKFTDLLLGECTIDTNVLKDGSQNWGQSAHFEILLLGMNGLKI